MKQEDQGTREHKRQRYQVIPRTLVFLTSTNPVSAAQEVLLLKGAPTKRLWANLYNGIGGHVEADEDVYAAALREVSEETGLVVTDLTLRGVVNIDTGHDEQGPRPGVLMFVFVGSVTGRTVHASAEGTPEWIPVAQIQDYPLVSDLYAVLPRALAGPFFYGHYAPDAEGVLQHAFQP